MRSPHLCSALILLCSVTLCAPALAQSDDGPSSLELGVLDVSAKTNRSLKVRPAVRSWLIAQTNLKLVDTTKLRKTLKKQRVTEVALRQEKLIKRKTKRISQAMSTHDVQGLLLMNVKAKGSRTQLTFMTVGPEGAIIKQAQHLYTSKKGVSEEQVHDMLDVTVSALRRHVFPPKSSVPRELVPLEEPDEPTAKATKDGTQKQEKDAKQVDLPLVMQALPWASSLELSGLWAYRSIEFNTAQGSLLYSTPFIGARAALTIGLNDDKLHVAARAEGAYGVGSARAFEDDLSLNIEGTLMHLRLGAQIGYTLHERLALLINLDAQALSMLVEVNDRYTGHRYLSAMTLIGVRWLAIDALAISAQIGHQTVFKTQTSGDAFGAGALATLGGAHARLSALYSLDPSIGVTLGYTPQWLFPDYDVATTTSDDVVHVIHVGAQVQF